MRQISRYFAKKRFDQFSILIGIPDFRTPGSGLYANLQKFELPTPESIFDIHFFRNNPQPFNVLAQEIWPGRYRPTPGHCFVKILSDKGLLRRMYTQNVDGLECIAGLPRDRVVACHGSFDTASCIDCRRSTSPDAFLLGARAGIPARCVECGGLTKPDIVFFGEKVTAAIPASVSAVSRAYALSSSCPMPLMPLWTRTWRAATCSWLSAPGAWSPARRLRRRPA